MSRLGDVLVDIKPGFASRDDLDSGVFQFRMHNFTRESALNLTKRRRVNATSRQLEMQSVIAGDVLFNSTNSPELVGKSALIGDLDEPAVFSNHFMRLRPDPALLDPGYLAHFLRHQFARGVFRAMAKAWVNQATVGRDRLEDLDIPVPPLPEQRRITAILDHSGALRAKRRQVLSRLGTLTQAIFQDLFGSEEWRSTLGELTDVQIGPFGSLLHQEDYVAGGVAVINPMHIRGGAIQPDPDFSVTKAKASTLSLYRLRSGDVVLGRRGEMGRAGVAGIEHEGMICGTGSLILRPLDVDSMFLHAVVTSPRMKSHLERNSLGATLPNLNAGIVRTSPAPNAPAHAQREFATRVAQVERAVAVACRAAIADDELFNSLQSRAFRGDL